MGKHTQTADFKTINGVSIVGSGDLVVSGGGSETVFNNTLLQNQEVLVPLTASITTTPIVSVTKDTPQIDVQEERWLVGSAAFQADVTTELEVIKGSWVEKEKGLEAATLTKTSNLIVSAYYQGGVAFNATGTKMYKFTNTRTISQYSLTTAWDISTLVDDLLSFTHLDTTESLHIGLCFNNTGTKLYTIGNSTDRIFEITLSTAYDITTASTTMTTYSLLSQSSTNGSFYIKPDGLKFYVCTYYQIHEYTMSVAWSVASATFTASYPLSTFGVSYSNLVHFSSDGLKMYTDDSGSTSEYRLTTAWNISTAYLYRTYNSPLIGTVGGIFSKDASNLIILSSSGLHELNIPYGNYYLTSGYSVLRTKPMYDIITKYWSVVDSITSVHSGTIPFAYYLTDDMYYIPLSSTVNRPIIRRNTITNLFEVNSNTLNTADTVWTGDYPTLPQAVIEAMLVYGTNYLLTDGLTRSGKVYDATTPLDSSARSVFMHPDGTYMYVTGSATDKVNQVELVTPYDITTPGTVTSFSVSAQETNPTNLVFSTDGTKMYIVGSTGDDINQYALSTAWTVTTAVFEKIARPSSAEVACICFNPTGTKLFLFDNIGEDIMEYSLATAWDIATTTYIREFSVNDRILSLQFIENGTKLIIYNDETGDAEIMNLPTAYSLLGASDPSRWISNNISSHDGMYFVESQKKLYAVEASGDVISEFVETKFYRNKMILSSSSSTTVKPSLVDDNFNTALFFPSSVFPLAPTFTSLKFQYDANTVKRQATAGVDYQFDFTAQQELKFKALTAGTYRGRVI